MKKSMRRYKVTSWHIVPNIPNGGYRITETYNAKTRGEAIRQAEETWSRSRHKMTIEGIQEDIAMEEYEARREC